MSLTSRLYTTFKAATLVGFIGSMAGFFYEGREYLKHEPPIVRRMNELGVFPDITSTFEPLQTEQHEAPYSLLQNPEEMDKYKGQKQHEKDFVLFALLAGLTGNLVSRYGTQFVRARTEQKKELEARRKPSIQAMTPYRIPE